MMKYLVKNSSFFLLMIAFGINLGAFDAMCTFADSIVNVDSTVTIGWVYFVFVIGGAVGALSFGLFISKYQIFRPLIFVGYSAAVILMFSFGILTQFLDESIIWPLYVLGAISGFTLVGLCTAGLEYGAELTFPIPECSSSALLLTSEQIFAVIFIEFISLLDIKGYISLYILGFVEAIALVLLFFVRDRLGRVLVDKRIIKKPLLTPTEEGGFQLESIAQSM